MVAVHAGSRGGGRASHARAADSVVTLTGHVRTWAEHDAVLGVASMARGVIDVRDNLQVTG